MYNSLLNPIQEEELGVCVFTRPKLYYYNDFGCQLLHFYNGAIIPVLY